MNSYYRGGELRHSGWAAGLEEDLRRWDDSGKETGPGGSHGLGVLFDRGFADDCEKGDDVESPPSAAIFGG